MCVPCRLNNNKNTVTHLGEDISELYGDHIPQKNQKKGQSTTWMLRLLMHLQGRAYKPWFPAQVVTVLNPDSFTRPSGDWPNVLPVRPHSVTIHTGSRISHENVCAGRALTGMGACNGNLRCTQGPAAFTLSNLELPRRLGDNLELLLGRIQRRTSCQYTDLNLKCQVWNAGCPSWAKRQRKWQGPWGVSQRWVQDKTQDTSSENSGVEPSGKGQMSTSWRRTKSEPGRPMLRCPPRGPTESRSPGDEAERVRANGADEWGRRQARGGLRAWNAARARSLQPPVGSAHGRPHAWGLLTLSRHTGRGSRKLYYSEISREQGKKLLTLLLPIRELSFLLGILNSSNVYEADMIFSLKIYEWKD